MLRRRVRSADVSSIERAGTRRILSAVDRTPLGTTTLRKGSLGVLPIDPVLGAGLSLRHVLGPTRAGRVSSVTNATKNFFTTQFYYLGTSGSLQE